ncbi:hypothetical protein [Kitasatospora aureofaciens]|uniref:hypothetical protein n=1 Tax=Kitasatospora aureofaciens TaxID=1894 RepID=UPI000525E5BE|nr:hypothetical protein [Kitasatospora aureofaciens]
MSTHTSTAPQSHPDATGSLLLSALDAAPLIALVLAELPSHSQPAVHFAFTPTGATAHYAGHLAADERTAVTTAVTRHFQAAQWGQKLTQSGIQLIHPHHIAPHLRTDPMTLSGALAAVAGDEAANLLDAAGHGRQATALRAARRNHDPHPQTPTDHAVPPAAAPIRMRAVTTYTGFADPVETGTVYGQPGIHVTDAPVVEVEHVVPQPAVRLTVQAAGAQYLKVVLTGSTGPWAIHPGATEPGHAPDTATAEPDPQPSDRSGPSR